MSTDTTQIKEHYELQIQQYACIDLCKECYAHNINQGMLFCHHDDPSPINCNVLRVHGDF